VWGGVTREKVTIAKNRFSASGGQLSCYQHNPPQPSILTNIAITVISEASLLPSSECRYSAKMPRAQVIPDQLRPEIERRILVDK
jgi:hypothetical protein